MQEPHMRLRWDICKALGKTLDDPIFETMSLIQMLAYAHLIHKDKLDEEEMWRDRIEYLARFWDNESVEKVQEARRHSKGMPDAGFNRVLERMFGRGLGSDISPELKKKSIQQLGQDIVKANT
jgi:hypothetical protein